MSQESPNSQPPPPPAPQDKTAKLAQNSFQSVLKLQTIKFLRGTIRVLEGTVVKLEAAEPTSATASPSNWLNRLQTGWSAALAQIRSWLPENLSSQLSDTVLSGIIAGIAVVLVYSTSSVLSSKPQTVAIAPSPEPQQPPEVVLTPSPEPEKPPEVVLTPSPEPEKPPEVVLTPSPELEPAPTPTIPIPPELTTPAEPESVEVIPNPTPTVELTPEQTLIAAIENQVAEISDRFADGLIQSIQVNFEGSNLTLQLGDQWYNIQPSEQDKLANRMLQRSRDLDFSHLEITDSQGKLLARSPVVGKEMVILKRQLVMGNG